VPRSRWGAAESHSGGAESNWPAVALLAAGAPLRSMPDQIFERTALKEWAVLVDAMARGEFCAMIRKGGVREQRAGFSVRHDRFVMYPTFFHEKSEELVPSVRVALAESHARRPPEGTIELAHVGQVRAVWRVTDLETLRGIEGEHGLEWKAVESRFHYRNNPVVHVVALQLQSLPQPITVPEARRYLGCVSWVELDAEIEVSAARPIVDAARVNEAVARLTSALGQPIGEGEP
jgi:hypothetical protein